MARVIHFEIQAENPDRAISFYENLFGWEFTKWDGPQPYWLVKTGPEGQPGINGGGEPPRGGGGGPAGSSSGWPVDSPSFGESAQETPTVRGAPLVSQKSTSRIAGLR